jgi:hypothetical protein
MTFQELLNTITTLTDAEAKNYWMTFNTEVYETLMSIQEQHPSQHQVAPVQLTNEDWALCADILREAALGGLYADGFSLLPIDLFTEVSVITAEEFQSLLPVQEEEIFTEPEELNVDN